MTAKFKVQRRVAAVRGAAKSIGQVWVTVAKGKREVVAETIARSARIEFADDIIRIVRQ